MAVRFSADGEDYTRTLSLGSQTQWSVTCWVKISADTNNFATVWCADTGAASIECVTDSNGTTLRLYDQTGTFLANPSRALTVGTWYYVGAAFSGSNVTFVTRALTDTGFTVQTGTDSDASINFVNFRLSDDVFGGNWLNGCLAAVKLWTGVTLTQAELEQEAWTYAPRRTAGIRAVYPFITAGTTDYSGLGNTLSGGSGTSTEDGPPLVWGGTGHRVVLPAAGAVTASIGQAVETDSAQPVTVTRIVPIGQATETDTAQAMTARIVKVVPIGQAVETDTAFPVSAIKALGQATETDTAFPVTVKRVVPIGQAVETDTAPSVRVVRIVHIGQAVETDTAWPVTVPTPPISYELAIDWDDDGSFTGDDIITGRVLASDGVEIQYGRDQARAGSPIAPGEAGWTIDNRSADYSPDNTASPLYGKVRPHLPVRIRATQGINVYTLYQGFLDEYEFEPNLFASTVRIGALDVLADLKEAKISTALYQGVHTGEAIGHILDAVGWPVDKRDLDQGATYIRWWWVEEEDAFTALSKLVDSEGPPAFVHADEDGNFLFRDRHHRVLNAESNTVQQTFRSSGAEPLFSAPMTYDYSWKDIVNSVSIDVEERDPLATQETVWESDRIYTLGASESIEVIAVTDEPFYAAEVEYTLNSGSVSVSGVSPDSAQSATITLTAGGSGASFTDLHLVAYSVAVRRTFKVVTEDTTSQGKYRLRSFTPEAPWAGVTDAEAIGSLLLEYRAERLPAVQVRFISSGSANQVRQIEQLRRDLSDRIHLEEPDSSALDDDFFIERIQHVISQGGKSLETIFGCEQAIDPQPSTPITFDVAGRGFGDGSFAL